MLLRGGFCYRNVEHEYRCIPKKRYKKRQKKKKYSKKTTPVEVIIEENSYPGCFKYDHIIASVLGITLLAIAGIVVYYVYHAYLELLEHLPAHKESFLLKV